MWYHIRPDAAVKVKIYDGEKYKPGSKVRSEYIYKVGQVVSFQTVYRRPETVKAMGFDEFDPRGEYLVLALDDGDEATFRNSFVDMFLC